MSNIIVKYYKNGITFLLCYCLFFPLIYSQEKDSAYYKAKVREIIQLKNQLNDSVFIKAEELKKELKKVGGFDIFITQTQFAEANYFYRKQQFGEAISRYQALLDEATEKKDTLTATNAKESIANVYQYLDEHEKVVEYFSEGYNYWRKIDSKRYLARSARNIAESQTHLGNYEEAKIMLDTAIAIYTKLNDSAWTSISYYYLASLYSTKIKTSIENKNNNLTMLNKALINGRSYFLKGYSGSSLDGSYKYLEAENAFLNKNNFEAIFLAKEAYLILKKERFSAKSDIPATTLILAKAYTNNKNYKEATKYLHIHQNYMDSLAILSKNKIARNHKLKVAYKNKKAEEELQSIAKVEQEKVAHQAYLDRQQTYYVIGGVAIIPIIIILLIIFKRHRKLKWFYMQLYERTKDLNDSINYAEKIQRAMLPVKKDIADTFKEHFVLFKPKHIVAGDFYWLQTKNNYVYLAVADCTGHGVPGALVSLVCHEALQRSLHEFNLFSTKDILNKTRDLLKIRFKYSGEDSIKDGMDIALCKIDLKNNNVEFSGANNPLWILRDNEMIACKGDKQPVGEYYAEKPFTSIDKNLEEGDVIYLFSDGYIDQFGGETGKKLKTPNFRKFIIGNSESKLAIQGKLLAENFENWRRDIEQIDDVCVIGVKI